METGNYGTETRAQASSATWRIEGISQAQLEGSSLEA